MLPVQLEPYEYERARTIGLERAERYSAFGHRQDYAEAWTNSIRAEDMVPVDVANVNAALLELAVAKHLGVYWHGHGGALDRSKQYRHLPDVGDRYEIRHVLREDAGPRIYEKDVDYARPHLELWAGHIRGASALIFGGIRLVDAWEISETCGTCKRWPDSRRICQSHLTIPSSQGRNPQ